jgi:hypothetical protein
MLQLGWIRLSCGFEHFDKLPQRGKVLVARTVRKPLTSIYRPPIVTAHGPIDTCNFIELGSFWHVWIQPPETTMSLRS